MMKMVQKMKAFLIVALGLTTALVVAGSAMADTLNISGLDTLVYGTTTYGSEYVGPIGAALGSSAIAGGITCLDINTQTIVPGSFNVYVGRLSPVDLSHAKFASTATLFNYQEAAALLGQMASHPNEIGEISFAIWRIFTPSHAPGPDAAKEDAWLAWAAGINVNDYDFSSVRIYTPSPNPATNQEFMSGVALAKNFSGGQAPIPASFVLLASGLLGLGILGRKKKAVLFRKDDE